MMSGALRGGAFPLALFAFCAIGVRYLGGIFTTNTRWGFLALLLIIVAANGQLASAFRNRISLFLYTYGAWCLATAMWSPVPELSLTKATAVLLVSVTFISGGQYWIEARPSASPLAHLLPIAALALIAGLFSRGSVGADQSFLRQGLTGNANQLGLLVAAGSTYLFYQAYLAFRSRSVGRRVITSGLILLALVLLWMASSRSAVLCTMVIALCGFGALRPSKQLLAAIVVGSLVAGALVVAPSIQDKLYRQLVIKNESTAVTPNSGDVFNSRLGPWEQSYAGAVQGGLLGLGYGVSAGYTDFSGGLTANTYGREKGNSQLAIVEEIGLVGLFLYGLILLAIVRELLTGIKHAPDQNTKVAMSLLLGTVLGLLCQSVFEAWWTAPGSTESGVFWATVGTGVAFSRRFAAQSVRQKRAASAQTHAPLTRPA